MVDVGDLSFVALAMALITLVADWVMQYWLVIRWGPNLTKNLVIGEFKNRDTARLVREALDLPTREELKALKEEIRAKDLAYQATLDSRMSGLLKDLSAAMPKIDLSGVEARIQGAVEGAVKQVSSGFIGAESKKRNKEMEAMTAQYLQSQQAQYDQQYMMKVLQQLGIPPGMAQIAATFGPAGFEWALKEAFGDRRASELMGNLSAAKTAAMPMIIGGGLR